MIDGKFDARGHIINDGLDDYGRPLHEVRREARSRREFEERLEKLGIVEQEKK